MRRLRCPICGAKAEISPGTCMLPELDCGHDPSQCEECAADVDQNDLSTCIDCGKELCADCYKAHPTHAEQADAHPSGCRCYECRETDDGRAPSFISVAAFLERQSDRGAA